MSSADAEVTQAGSFSSGVGVAVRSHIGLALPAVQPSVGAEHRFHLRWVGAFATGGFFLGSVYLRCSEGASTANLDLLQVIAGALNRVSGQWLIAVDFNMMPEALQQTGWLRLVKGVVHRPHAPTCNGKEYDYFVSSQGLAEAVVGVAVVEGTGISPHLPARIFLKRKINELKVRNLLSPMKLPASLPSGCLENPALQDAELVQAVGTLVSEGRLDSPLATWTCRMEDQIVAVMGLEGKEADKAKHRAQGPRFVIKPALGPPGSKQPRCSVITTAWRSAAGWLLAVQRALGSPERGLAKAADRARWRLQHHHWKFVRTSKHVSAFLRWMGEVRRADLNDRRAVAQLLSTASIVADKATEHDDRRAQASWLSRSRDGPARGLGRQHRLSRVAEGWIPSALGAGSVSSCDQPDTQQAVAHQGEADAIREDGDGRLDGAEVSIPQSSQQAVDAEAEKWKQEWQVGADIPLLHWPEDDQHQKEMAQLSVEVVVRAAKTFPEASGLGWDKAHPKSLLRCSGGVWTALVMILEAIERAGEWPGNIDVVLICLLPKPDGGLRPIGLLPSLIRLWMRARLDVARAWQSANERPFFYAGSGKGALPAARLPGQRWLRTVGVLSMP